MQIYLPVAEISIDAFLLLGLGGMIGVLSGMFGIGGGFMMTPLLIFIGIPAPVAVGTQTNSVIASSVSGAMAHWPRGNVDIKMGLVLLVGGLLGSSLGVMVFSWLKSLGQIDVAIKLIYVATLGTVGSLMLAEAVRSVFRRRRKIPARKKLHTHHWVHGLPFKMRFRKSRLYISALLPLAVGFGVGFLSAMMGIGGGFMIVPAMIYLLGMPTTVVIGTSLFQIIFVAANVTFLQAWENQTVDVVLALLLLAGSVVGAQIGTRLGARLQSDALRLLLALLVLLVGGKLTYDLFTPPVDVYVLGSGL
ncbi:MAG: sulfite exporter TauE/SafE family protein [Rhodospirillales bacterium]|nr:sulfite exporter TauE/SafE family protein [Rhodospirillales bacterium]